MPDKREILKMFSGAVALLLLIILFYSLFQQEKIYPHTLGLVAGNYRNDGDQIYKAKVPYEKFSPDKMVHWDAALYQRIKESGYDIRSAGGDYIFAFFPLFPFAWKLSGLSAMQISLVNYLLWITSLIILTLLFIPKETKYRWRYVLILAGVPLLAAFLIPYSEGLFMFCMTLAFWGLYKSKYALYFTGAMLASMTRSSVSVLLLALLFTELYFLFQHYNSLKALKSFALKSLPLIIGTAGVSLIQFSYGSDHIAKFIEVEKYWGYKLQWPGGITDWAHEQFSSNLPMVFVVLPAMLAFLGYHTIRNLRAKRPVNNLLHLSETSYHKEYLFVLSLFFMTGIMLTMLLLRGGSLNGISRYAGCTPFFALSLIVLREKVSGIDPKTVKKMFILAVTLTVIALSLVRYSHRWNFSDLGFLLFYFQIAFFTFAKLIENRWLVATFIMLTALWASYLFSMFISNAWIIT